MNIYKKQIYISKRPSVRKVLPITTDNEHDYFIIKYCQVLFDISKNNLILMALLKFRERKKEMIFISITLNVV